MATSSSPPFAVLVRGLLFLRLRVQQSTEATKSVRVKQSTKATRLVGRGGSPSSKHEKKDKKKGCYLAVYAISPSRDLTSEVKCVYHSIGLKEGCWCSTHMTRAIITHTTTATMTTPTTMAAIAPLDKLSLLLPPPPVVVALVGGPWVVRIGVGGSVG